MRFLLKFPSRSRPKLWADRVREWSSKSSGRNEINWLCSFDNDDSTMRHDQLPSVEIPRHVMLGLNWGDSKTKVEAVNADMDKVKDVPWNVLILVSDDFHCLAYSWDEIMVKDMLASFPDLNGALLYGDGRQTNPPATCTFSVMGRPVYEEMGFIYHPAFKSVYCDNYYHDLMTRTNRLKFCDHPIVRHAWREENNDALMDRNEAHPGYDEDRRTYERLVACLQKNNMMHERRGDFASSS
jgi:hypothetical protein